MKDRIQSLNQKLPELATQVILTYLDQSIEYNADFAKRPDWYYHHKPQWHEFGIITHTREFLHAHNEDVPTLLKTWGVYDLSMSSLSQPIDGIAKKELIQLGILLHDIGKFAVRHLSRIQINQAPLPPDFSFGTHEAVSEKIIHSPLLSPLLESYNLSPAHIHYIGRCAALHYEISKIRDKVKHTPRGYSLEFISSDDFKIACHNLIKDTKDYAIEIGLMYLGDHLGKNSYWKESLQKPSNMEIEGYISAHDLDKRFASQVHITPVALAAAEYYMRSLM